MKYSIAVLEEYKGELNEDRVNMMVYGDGGSGIGGCTKEVLHELQKNGKLTILGLDSQERKSILDKYKLSDAEKKIINSVQRLLNEEGIKSNFVVPGIVRAVNPENGWSYPEEGELSDRVVIRQINVDEEQMVSVNVEIDLEGVDDGVSPIIRVSMLQDDMMLPYMEEEFEYGENTEEFISTVSSYVNNWNEEYDFSQND